MEFTLMRKLLACSLALYTTSAICSPDTNKVAELIALDLDKIMDIKVATDTPKELAEAPSVISIITEEDIKATGAKTLAEAIQGVPGIHVTESHLRSHTMYSLRGIQTDYTPHFLMLIDGVAEKVLSSPLPLNFPVNSIKRIEVIRGPNSAVYGADAFSGVINVITKRGKDVEGSQIGGSLGSFDSEELWVSIASKEKNLLSLLTIYYGATMGDRNRKTPVGILNSEREDFSIHLNLDYENWSMTNLYYQSRVGLGTSAGIWANNHDFADVERYRLNLSYDERLNEFLEFAANIVYTYHDSETYIVLFPSGEFPVGFDGNLLTEPFTPVDFPSGVIGNPSTEGKNWAFNAKAIFSPNNGHRLRVALGYDTIDFSPREKKNFGPGILDTNNYKSVSESLVDVTGTPFIFAPKYKRELYYISLQDEVFLTGNIELTIGLRYDYYNDFGSTINPRIAMVWNTFQGFNTKLLFGKAFRAPNINELSFRNNPTVIGNPELDSEEISMLELVFDYQINNQISSVINFYNYKADKLISQDLQFVYQNKGVLEGYGAELELMWKPSSAISVTANYAYQKSEDPNTEEDKSLAPRSLTYFALRYNISEGWLATIQSKLVKNRKRERLDSRPEVSDYLKTDFILNYRTDDNAWNIQLKINNVFNEDIREPVPNTPLFNLDFGFSTDIPMEGRAAFVSASYKF